MICMRGFPNRMLYPDFKMRYACLGQAEIASSGDNKTAVYALMDKIAFDRERYRLGHTLVFFRAGALAKLEEGREELVIKWIRFLQGEIFKRIRGKEYAKRRDQRELIKVCQRNFRKFLAMRDWGWFVIIQKTRGLIGLPNPEEELRLLEEKANATYGEYQAALETTKNLEGQMGNLKDEIATMTKQLQEEQGNISVYTDRQSKALTLKNETGWNSPRHRRSLLPRKLPESSLPLKSRLTLAPLPQSRRILRTLNSLSSRLNKRRATETTPSRFFKMKSPNRMKSSTS